jgi:hypothetical protein
MPRRAGKSWRVVAGLAFVADAMSARVTVFAIQMNASGCCFGARALRAGERFYLDT